MQRKPRRRRDPADARREILEGAERLFAERSPDVVGLKDVAGEVGVSHALVTHYFGTYDALVEAVLERRIAASRERTLARLADGGAPPSPAELLASVFDLLDDPVHVRLSTWAILSGRAHARDFFSVRQRGMKRVADAIVAALARADGGRAASGRRGVDADAAALHADVEFAVLLSVAAAYGYTVGRDVFLGGLGRRPSGSEDADFRTRLAALLHEYIARRLGAG